MHRYPDEILRSFSTLDHIRTRFSPEPNGKLHIGDVKAMEIDFGLRDYAKSINKTAECYLRFDDTNPTKENQDFIDGILEDLKWLNYVPDKITYTSDYFDQLYEYAIKLILMGHCYVCGLSEYDIKRYREFKKTSPFRNATIEDNLEKFENMKTGIYVANSYTLRMKGDLNDPDSCMWDPIFYRIMHVKHHRTGNKWCIYPTYDFSHCIVDSLENITYSLCTTEFISHRKSYFWLLEKLDLKKPIVYEFGKLNVTQNILSKRKIAALIDSKIVEDWDDPRLLTVCGLKRRGYVPEAIRRFCYETGVTKTDATLEYTKLEQCGRTVLEYIAPRRFALLDPLKIVFQVDNISNIFDDPAHNDPTLFDYPIHSREILSGKIESVPLKRRNTRVMKITPTIFIERNDFRIEDSKDFYGLSPNKIVRLKYSGFVKCVGYYEEYGRIEQVYVVPIIPDKPKAIKGILNWLNNQAKDAEFRIYQPLLNESGEINEMSLTTLYGRIEPSMGEDLDDDTTYQFERLGYFKIDPSSIDEESLIYNQTMPQKSSY
jgi:glutaminyl-tRNA synthetase